MDNWRIPMKERRDGDQPGAVSKRFVDSGVHGALRNRGEVPRCVGGVALADGFCLSGMWLHAPWYLRAQGTAVLAVLGVPGADHGDLRHDLSVHQAAVDDLVSGHALADAGQEQRVGLGTQTPPGSALQNGLADQAQADGGHARA